ncbi:drug resistance transporter, EmrB/QacA subfamily [Paenibacillus sp. UNCCL117]|uniref:MFS transporter n=1 Tax=unclassified Paenibacillus TaxID=185978 RepID=UPI00088518B5|nr:MULTISPECIES: MFS transporter [unclassified Paenibacillus]SDD84054.1 drug resistance transporter, EmrB/QacA subfamily [Paenibacillus sp. cl123]SFW54708.1 drug resistance transporter, EmrB/QacA subfamily [Paenibacillus sp. UNCCL117]
MPHTLSDASAQPVQTRESISEGDGRGSRLMLPALLLPVFMAVANVFIVNVATPSIQKGLGASFTDVQFILTGYTLTFAVLLIMGARLGDRFGRRRMLFVGVALFTVASLLCGLSAHVGMLIAFRVLQGVGAALFMPQVLSLIQANYAPERRGAVFGMYGATQGIAATAGQIIGGLLLRMNVWDLEWRTVFLISVLLGALILALIPFIPESGSPDRAGLDWIGAALAATGLLMLVYPLVQGQREGWPAGLVVSLLLSAPVLALFTWYERRLLRRGRLPFMNVDLFRHKVFTFGILVVLLLMSSQGAFFLVAAYMLQLGLHFSPLQAGLVIMPMGLGYFLASLFSSRVTAKLGAHVLTVGSILTTAGYLLLGWAVRTTGGSSDIGVWLPALTALGIGQGLVAAPLTNIVLAKIRTADIGSASGVMTTSIQIASTIGIALIGIVWLNALEAHTGSVSAFPDAFTICLYVLAAASALILPLAWILAGRNAASRS